MSEQKPSNPKDALGIAKVPFHAFPFEVLAEASLGMGEGGLKYGTHNYRVIGVRASTYVSAAMRHMAAWWEGQDIDPDSGLSHLTKAICSLAVVRDAMIHRQMEDDRPPLSGRDPNWMAELNAAMAKLLEKYPAEVRKAPFTEAEHGVSRDTAEVAVPKKGPRPRKVEPPVGFYWNEEGALLPERR